MSDLLGEIADVVGLGGELDALRDFLGLRGLKPGSFRGIPFHVQTTDYASGRRIVVHEYPLRDATSTEDMGRTKREITISAYVIGEDWKQQRDELLWGCEDFDKPGTLVLPGGMEFIARCATVRITESGDSRGVASFALTFAEAGESDRALKSKLDTASVLRNAVGRMLRLVRTGFALVFATKDFGDLVGRAAIAGLTSLGQSFAANWLGLPGLDLAGTLRAIEGVATADPENPVDAVVLPSRALADAALAMPSTQAGPVPSEATTSRAEPAPSRRDVAVALLRQATQPLAQPTIGAGVIAQRIELNRLALDALSRDAATLMAAEILSATDFGSLSEARQLRDSLLDAIDQRADVAADAGQDDVFRGWRDVAAAAARDMTERARRAPLLAGYKLPESLPSLALSQRLYQSGVMADQLVGLNDAPHPAFMPAAGVVLRR